MTTLFWLVLPYLALAVFVLGHVWRWRHDQFGWTTFTTQLVENRLLHMGSPLFHLGTLAVLVGHLLGLLGSIRPSGPRSWRCRLGWG